MYKGPPALRASCRYEMQTATEHQLCVYAAQSRVPASLNEQLYGPHGPFLPSSAAAAALLPHVLAPGLPLASRWRASHVFSWASGQLS